MLTYIIQATADLLPTSILVGMLVAFAGRRWQGRGAKALLIAFVAALAASLVFAIVRKNTSLVDVPLWNMRTAAVSIAALVVFAVATALPRLSRKSCQTRDGASRPRIAGICQPLARIALAVLLFACCFFVFPVVMAYPGEFDTGGVGVLSTDFLVRLIGMMAGIVLMLVLGIGTMRVFAAIKGRFASAAALVGTITMVVPQAMLLVQTLMTRHIIAKQAAIYKFVKMDDSIVFTVIMVALVLVGVVLLLVQASRAREPYDNPAQHRKIRATWRSRRRWVAAVVVCVALSLFNLTVLAAIDSQEVELSPSEECQIGDDGLYIPFDQVDDGALHRFTYDTPNGVAVRFIVIRKPNSQAYGIGLDACEICGETGYYERDGQVVCKLCDVVMNINTIGFKGGCNPIPIDYRIEDGCIIVPFQTLVEHEDIFTR